MVKPMAGRSLVFNKVLEPNGTQVGMRNRLLTAENSLNGKSKSEAGKLDASATSFPPPGLQHGNIAMSAEAKFKSIHLQKTPTNGG